MKKPKKEKLEMKLPVIETHNDLETIMNWVQTVLDLCFTEPLTDEKGFILTKIWKQSHQTFIPHEKKWIMAEQVKRDVTEDRNRLELFEELLDQIPDDLRR